MDDTKVLPCPECKAPVVFETDTKWVKDRKINCKTCGASVVDNTAGEAIANERFTLEEAMAITAPYTRNQILDIAERGYSDPSSLSPAEIDLIAAFVRTCAGKEKHN